MLVFRQALLEDVTQLTHCMNQVIEEEIHLARQRAFTEAEVKASVDSLARGQGCQWVAGWQDEECREHLVGWCDIRPTHPGEGQLAMGVMAPFRRQGVGARLLHHALEQASDQGLEIIDLEVFANNDAALMLYRGAGFAETGPAFERECSGQTRQVVPLRLTLASAPAESVN